MRWEAKTQEYVWSTAPSPVNPGYSSRSLTETLGWRNDRGKLTQLAQDDSILLTPPAAFLIYERMPTVARTRWPGRVDPRFQNLLLHVVNDSLLILGRIAAVHEVVGGAARDVTPVLAERGDDICLEKRHQSVQGLIHRL